MEFEISPTTQLHLQGHVMLQLPKYMRTIPHDQIQEVAKMSDRGQVIVACGYDKGVIILVTGDAQMMRLNVREHDLPAEDCLPIARGRTVLFPQAILADNTSYKVTSEALIIIANPMNVHFGGEPSYEDDAEDSVKNPSGVGP